MLNTAQIKQQLQDMGEIVQEMANLLKERGLPRCHRCQLGRC